MGIGSGVVNKDAPCSHPKRDELFPLLIRMISIFAHLQMRERHGYPLDKTLRSC